MALPSRRLLRNVRLFWYAHHTLQRGNKAKAGSIVLVSSRTTTKRINLSNYQPSTIAWIPSLKACLMFFGGSWGKRTHCYLLLEVRREYFAALLVCNDLVLLLSPTRLQSLSPFNCVPNCSTQLLTLIGRMCIRNPLVAARVSRQERLVKG